MLQEDALVWQQNSVRNALLFRPQEHSSVQFACKTRKSLTLIRSCSGKD